MDAALTKILISNTSTAGGQCTTSSNSFVTCQAVLEVSNCSGSFKCDTAATQLNCTPDGDMAGMAALITKIINSIAAGVSGAAAAIDSVLQTSNQGSTTDLSVYLSSACTTFSDSQQKVSLPKVVLNDCKHVNFMAINRLDSKSQCLLSEATQVLQAAGLGTPATDSAKDTTSMFLAITGFFVGTLGLAILLALFLRKRLAEQMQTQTQAQY